MLFESSMQLQKLGRNIAECSFIDFANCIRECFKHQKKDTKN